MPIFLQSDHDLWDEMLDGPFASMKQVDRKKVPKTREAMDYLEKRNIVSNAKAMNILHYALNLSQFNKVYMIKMKKILRCLPPSLDPNMIKIQGAKDVKTLPLEENLGHL
ncbi:hypothetical protein Patl1_23749 [Pistacia atlantica]|uniref:Uncharacterized protein n=1 Tax=Pistacia atlantica TaxID=434234 RepID=A0ACC0ZYH6_9ROSI|nr:hypothetical protein Patl1_23749 [Pistacia atlantica]